MSNNNIAATNTASSHLITPRQAFMALMLTAGNVLLPMLCHIAGIAGPVLLPIYFFTLAGVCLYGWRVGLVTALLSPLISYLLTGMPADAMLLTVTVKSLLMVGAAALVLRHTGRVSLLSLVAIVCLYQGAGCLFEWALTGNAGIAIGHLHTGLPGMLLQIVGIRLLATSRS